MTDEQYRKLVEFYAWFVWKYVDEQDEKDNYIKSMFSSMLALNEAMDRDEMMRRLGFVQGVLWNDGTFGLVELEAHNTAEP